MKEIERKWVLTNMPTFSEKGEGYRTEQFYLHVSDQQELRFSWTLHYGGRREHSEYLMTVKLGKGLSRTEIETEITKEDYEHACLLSQGVPVTKTGIKYLCEGNPLYISLVDADFVTAEIEFPSEDAANGFDLFSCSLIEHPADWIEVTGNPNHSMKNYWVKKNHL